MSRHTFATGRNSWADKGFADDGGRGVYWEGDWEYTLIDEFDAAAAGADAIRAEDKQARERILKYPTEIPELVLRGLMNYVNYGLPVGGFLTAVLENDLRNAVQLADPLSWETIRPLMFLLHNEAPSRCWGCPERVKRWMAMDKAERDDRVARSAEWQKFTELVNTPPLEVA